MAQFTMDKAVVLAACQAYLDDKSNKDLPDVYIDNEIVQRVYDTLKSNVYNFTSSVILDEYEMDCLANYLKEV